MKSHHVPVLVWCLVFRPFLLRCIVISFGPSSISFELSSLSSVYPPHLFLFYPLGFSLFAEYMCTIMTLMTWTLRGTLRFGAVP